MALGLDLCFEMNTDVLSRDEFAGVMSPREELEQLLQQQQKLQCQLEIAEGIYDIDDRRYIDYAGSCFPDKYMENYLKEQSLKSLLEYCVKKKELKECNKRIAKLRRRLKE